MKVFNAAIWFILGAVVALFLYNKGTRGDGVVVKQSFLDSLTVVASQPPTVVVRDSIIYEQKVVVKKVNVPVAVKDTVWMDTSATVYSDSIVNEEINARVDMIVRGELLQLGWSYKPVIKEVTKEVTIYKPEPIPYEVKVPARGFMLTGGLGYSGNDNVMVSVGAGMVTRNKKYLGIDAGRLGSDNYGQLKIGIMF